MLDRLTFAGRAYHFPSAISLRIALSKVRSATARLSRAFSFSSSRSLLSASFLTPPQSLFQRCQVATLTPSARQTSPTFFPAASIPPASRSFLLISSGVCRFLFMLLDRALAQPNLTIHGSVCGDHSEGSRKRYLTGTSWEKLDTPWVESLWMLRSLRLSAAVHTQITDIKQGFHKWRTHDRAVSKIPVERLRPLLRRLNQTPPVLSTHGRKRSSGQRF